MRYRQFDPYSYKNVDLDRNLLDGDVILESVSSDRYDIPSEIGGHPVRVVEMACLGGVPGTKTVFIPASVQQIHDVADQPYLYLRDLERIEVSVENKKYFSYDGVLYSREGVLLACPSQRTRCNIAEGTTIIGPGAFGDSLVESVILPHGLTHIFYTAFIDCKKLRSLKLPDSLRDIGRYAFRGCEALTSITIPPGIEKFGYGAFTGCRSLRRLQLSEGLQWIGNAAFCGCENIARVQIPASVKEIGVRAFAHCSGIEAFDVAEENEHYASIGDALCTADGKGLIQAPSIAHHYRVPEGVEYVGEDAFTSNVIESIEFSNSVEHVSLRAFQWCSNLKRYTMPPKAEFHYRAEQLLELENENTVEESEDEEFDDIVIDRDIMAKCERTDKRLEEEVVKIGRELNVEQSVIDEFIWRIPSPKRLWI